MYNTEIQINVEGPRRMISFLSGGEVLFSISETVVTGWLVIILLFIAMKVLTHNLKLKPESKRQVIAEWIVEFFNNLVAENMGTTMLGFAPYICAIFAFALFGSLISMTGLRSMTADISCTGTWAAMTLFLITFYKIRTNGFFGYLKSYAEPTPVITPINLLSEVATPAAMGIRIFGNISSGMIITSMVYAALTVASNAVYNLIGTSTVITDYFKVFQIGIPAALSIYFDLFSSVIQSYVFIMLSMTYIGQAAGKE